VTDPRDAPQRRSNIQEAMAKTRIAPDLLDAMAEKANAMATPTKPEAQLFPAVVEMNAAFPHGPEVARAMLLRQFLKERSGAGQEVPEASLARRALVGLRPPPLPTQPTPLFDLADKLSVANSLFTDSYLFGSLTQATINRLGSLSVAIDGDANDIVHKVWSDHAVHPLVFESVRTIKCDAARAAFRCTGNEIVWAVADTGIDGGHPHFATHSTLKLPKGVGHRDFTDAYATSDAASKAALVDSFGHGTHVAGIIAGETKPTNRRKIKITQALRTSDVDNATKKMTKDHKEPISGLAPLCKILSLKVLRSGEVGHVSHLLAAIGYIQTLNAFGRNLKVHGLNLSLGYPFRPEWFAAGQSPLCVEVDRLVKSGVVVVVASGNSGYGTVNDSQGRAEFAAHASTIDDPGNADLAITVGSTHRDMPHTYGVSYFSGKGPTTDGRMKPDLVAPGERIVSCALMDEDAKAQGYAPYREESGTSMAAPHVSGAAAAFLSVRTEFIGKPDRVKDILQAGATDLKRKPEFQGAGLVDLMRSMQSV
jgi:serine protease AprX